MAILKQFVLGDKLKKFMWIGVAWNVMSIVIVGLVAMLQGSGSEEGVPDASGIVKNPVWGVILILSGAFVQSLQYAFEEKVMTMGESSPTGHDALPSDESNADEATSSGGVSAPPLLLIGMEGMWGTLICLFLLYPAAYYMPGPDHGSIENPYNTMQMIANSADIQHMFILYFFSILSYNILACLVTFMMDSVWHAILDNFRPISVWCTDLVIFYFISQAFGEEWTIYSYIQLLGMFVLLYGTAVYNAPNPGSIKLTGDPLSCFINCSDEYDDDSEGKGDASLEYEFGQSLASRGKVASGHGSGIGGGSHLNTMSPFLASPATTARREQERARMHRETKQQTIQMTEKQKMSAAGKKSYGSSGGSK